MEDLELLSDECDNDFDNKFDYYFDKQIRLKGGFGRPHLAITESMSSS